MKRLQERLDEGPGAAGKRIKLETDSGHQQQYQRFVRYQDSNGDFSYSVDVTELASDCHEEVCTSNASILDSFRVETSSPSFPGGDAEEPNFPSGEVLSLEDVRPRSTFRARASSDIPHTNRLQFACTVCDKYFSSEKYLSMHLSLHKPNAFGKDASSSTALTSGLGENIAPLSKLDANSSGSYGVAVAPRTCNFCNKTFSQNSNYKNHMRTHEDERPFVCLICSIGFKERYHLKKHVLFKHTTDLKETCKICGKCFKDSTAVRAHERIHSEARPYGCPICNKSFKTSECLWHHENRSKTCGKALLGHRNNASAPLTGKGPSRRARRVNLPILADDIPVKQEQIDVSDAAGAIDDNLLSSYIALNFGQIREEISHQETNAGVHPTTYDPQTLITANEFFKQLLQQNIKERSAELENINETANSLLLDDALSTDTADSEAASPEAVSNGETKYATTAGLDCTKCDKHFLSTATLEKHMAMHCEDRPYRCDLCDNGFKLKVHLKKHHLYRHSNEYPCECSICGKKFKDSSAVRLHERIHSVERPFECQCGKSFKTRENLWGHRNRGPCDKSQEFVTNNMQLFRSEEFGPIIGVPITSAAILQHFTGFLSSMNLNYSVANYGDTATDDVTLNQIQSIRCGGDVMPINDVQNMNRALPAGGSGQNLTVEEIQSQYRAIKQKVEQSSGLPTAVVSPIHRGILGVKQEVLQNIVTCHDTIPTTVSVSAGKINGSTQGIVISSLQQQQGASAFIPIVTKSNISVNARRLELSNVLTNTTTQQIPLTSVSQVTSQPNMITQNGSQKTVLPGKIKVELISGIKSKRTKEAQFPVLENELESKPPSLAASRMESATQKCPTVYKFLTTQNRTHGVEREVEPLTEPPSSVLNRRCAPFDDYLAGVGDCSLPIMEGDLDLDDIQLDVCTSLLSDEDARRSLFTDPVLTNSSLFAYPEPLSPSLSDYSSPRFDESDSLSDMTEFWMDGSDNVISHYWSSDSETLFTGLSPASAFDELTA